MNLRECWKMGQRHDLRKILFLDIETVPAEESYDALSERWKGLWNLKATNLNRWNPPDRQLPSGELYERAGIYAEFGKIVCISVGHFALQEGILKLRLKSFSGPDEVAILDEFNQLLLDGFPSKFQALCAHNGKEFDFPYLCRRSLIHGLGLPEALNVQGKKPWEITHLLDTMQMWTFGDYKHFTSLDLLAAALGIDTPKDEITGADVQRVFYHENNVDGIVRYCEKDVVALAAVYCALTEEPRSFYAHLESTVGK